MEPTPLITVCRASHGRIIQTVDGISDQELEGPSSLPGWSRSDVVAWCALKSRSHVQLFDGPMAGEVRRQFPEGYDHSRAVREATSQGATSLRDMLTTDLRQLEAAWSRLPSDLWTQEGVTTAGRRSMTEILGRHLRDVEVHHVDLDVGYTPSDWPAEFVELELAKRLRDLSRRADRAALLAWLLDRRPAPELGPW